jgi:hypothetical protein
MKPKPKCKCCGEAEANGGDGLCSVCRNRLHSSEEAQNYNSWTLTSSDEYREVEDAN